MVLVLGNSKALAPSPKRAFAGAQAQQGMHGEVMLGDCGFLLLTFRNVFEKKVCWISTGSLFLVCGAHLGECLHERVCGAPMKFFDKATAWLPPS